MNDDPTDDASEKNIFQNAINGVKPLKQTSHKNYSNSSKISDESAKIRQKSAEEYHDMHTPHQHIYTPDIAPDQTINFSRSNNTQRQLQMMHTGKIQIDCNLDLHGLPLTNAHNELIDFIAHCKTNHYEYVRIIHGKSHINFGKKTTIKSCINTWLKENLSILGFMSCREKDGGTGAVYAIISLAIE